MDRRWVRVLKSRCLHRTKTSATKSHCGWRRSLSKVLEIADKYLPRVKFNWSLISSQLKENRMERVVAPVFNHKSLQPDVVLWQKGELVYQIIESPSSTTGYLDLLFISARIRYSCSRSSSCCYISCIFH